MQKKMNYSVEDGFAVLVKWCAFFVLVGVGLRRDSGFSDEFF